MNALLISDLHLTVTPRDEYRWRVFDWLVDACIKHGVKYVFILGDLCDAKDFHSAKLVNRVVNNLLRLYRQGGLLKIYILRGNHDGVDPACPYFLFLGQFPWCHYVHTPYMQPFDGHEVLLLPHSRNPVADWAETDMGEAEILMLHATVQGACAENGVPLAGVPLSALRRAYRAQIYSGDVHVPQRIGGVEYVGAPYPIRFGDKYQGRAVLLKDFGKGTDLWIPSLNRWMVTVDPTNVVLPDVVEGDQIKVRMRLAPHDFVDWQKLKKQVIGLCTEAKVDLCGLELERVQSRKRILPRGTQAPTKRSPEEVLVGYCSANKVDPQTRAVGTGLLNTP